MSETVGSYEVIFRSACRDAVYDFLEAGIIGERKEYRLDIGIVDLDMAHTVIFLVAARQLVLLYNPVYIIIDIGSHHNTVLRATVHGLGIDIVMLALVGAEPSVPQESVEVLYGFGIHRFGMFVGAGGKIYLGFDDMVKRHFVAVGFPAGFFGIQHVVRTGCHFLNQFSGRADPPERFYFSHDE